MTLRVVELFAGIGAQASALERLGIDYTSTVCENDKHAYNAYCAIHGPTENLGDITKVEHLPECDLLTYSFPCQDLSIAGAKKGMAEGSGTRSSLLWEVERLLQDLRERERLPEVLLMENVDAILYAKNKPHLERFIARLTEMGYKSSYAVLNAKDYGIPQSRRRCFMVSTLHKGIFKFPAGRPLQRSLKDMLEDKVPESFYLSKGQIINMESHRIRQEANGRGFGWKPMDPERERVAHAITTNPYRQVGTFIIENPKSKGRGEPGQIIVLGLLDWKGHHESARRVYDPAGIAPCLPTCGGGRICPKIIDINNPPRIRYLTPRESLRLMGQTDSDIDKLIQTEPAKTQLYKLAGNSIVVDVLVAIFKGIFLDGTFTDPRPAQTSLEAWQ